MPPPIIPPAASGLASIVGQTVIDITSRQQTSVSTSDVIRGVHAALKEGLYVVDFTFPQLVCEVAHKNQIHGQGHQPIRDDMPHGFCRACAGIYAAVMEALGQANEVERSL